MKIKKYVLPLLILMAPCYLFSATIKHSKITVNGNVVARPCTIIPQNKAVDLGDIFTYNMAPYSEWVDFDITLKNCPDGTNNISATFTGDYDNQGGFYINKGTSKNIGIQLRANANNNFIKSGDTYSVSIDSAKSGVFKLSARAYKVGETNTGTLQSNINITYVWL